MIPSYLSQSSGPSTRKGYCDKNSLLLLQACGDAPELFETAHHCHMVAIRAAPPMLSRSSVMIQLMQISSLSCHVPVRTARTPVRFWMATHQTLSDTSIGRTAHPVRLLIYPDIQPVLKKSPSSSTALKNSGQDNCPALGLAHANIAKGPEASRLGSQQCSLQCSISV